jgi:hypothetical protein
MAFQSAVIDFKLWLGRQRMLGPAPQCGNEMVRGFAPGTAAWRPQIAVGAPHDQNIYSCFGKAIMYQVLHTRAHLHCLNRGRVGVHLLAHTRNI